MRSFFRALLFDPIKARIIYDALAITFSFLIIWVLFFIFERDSPGFFSLFFFGLLQLSAFAIFGVYGRYRLTSIIVKIIAIFCSLLISYLALWLLGFPLFFLTLWICFLFFIVILPRLAFSFTFEKSNTFYRHTLKQDHLPILVVGGGGYIGSHVVEQLLEAGFLVRVFDAFQYGRQVLADLINNPNLELVEGDISDIYKLTLAMQGVGAVVHLAGIVGDPACAVDPELTRHVNIVSTRILKESAKAMGARSFIFASSCSVYGATLEQADETSQLNPVSLYAQTKIDSERELLEDMHDAFHPVILRFATVFGHSRKPRFDLVANLFVAQAYVEGKINLTGKNQWRPFIHVRDVARAVVLALKSPEARVSRQIFNVGDNRLNTTIGELALLVQKVVSKSHQKKKVVIREKADVADQRNYSVSFDKIQKTLGFQAETSLEAGIAELYKCFKHNSYNHDYKNSYYSNLESTKELRAAFHSNDYRAKHLSVLSEFREVDRLRTGYRKKRS